MSAEDFMDRFQSAIDEECQRLSYHLEMSAFRPMMLINQLSKALSHRADLTEDENKLLQIADKWMEWATKQEERDR